MSQAEKTSILALDLGTTTGWAALSPDNRIHSGTASFKPGRYEGGGMRYLRFKRWLTEKKAEMGDIGGVYFEEVRMHRGVDAAHVYGGLMATLTAWCEHHEIPYQGVHYSHIKKFLTGKGNVKKDAMIAGVKALGYAPKDDNEADAIALLLYQINRRAKL